MQPNQNHPFMKVRKPLRHSLFAKRVQVDDLVQEVLLRNQQRIDAKNVSIESDCELLEVIAYPELLENGIEALVSNALERMADGGELSVTLIDGGHQWELEVADSPRQVSESSQRQSNCDTTDVVSDGLTDEEDSGLHGDEFVATIKLPVIGPDDFGGKAKRIQDDSLSDTTPASSGGLPVLLPFPTNAHLGKAMEIAAHHGGQLQSWPCPPGGKAFVLVIPNRDRRRNTA